MPLFIWKPSYDLHIPEIDNDHRQLVGMINELYETMKTGHGKEMSSLVINQLLDYIARHFDTEESFMRSNRFPGLQVHEEEHRSLRERVLALDQQRRTGNTLSTIDLLNFLCEWLRTHITVTDKEFGAYLKQMRG